nr:unnamed protein product [Callosobruchus analis]
MSILQKDLPASVQLSQSELIMDQSNCKSLKLAIAHQNIPESPEIPPKSDRNPPQTHHCTLNFVLRQLSHITIHGQLPAVIFKTSSHPGDSSRHLQNRGWPEKTAPRNTCFASEVE